MQIEKVKVFGIYRSKHTFFFLRVYLIDIQGVLLQSDSTYKCGKKIE